MVMRHPLHRLVSAFHYLFRASVNLKPIFVEQAATSWLAERIIRKVRPQSKDPLVSFHEFVDYVLDTEKKFTDLKAEEVSRWSWGASPVGISDHWQPFSSFCSPCRLLPHIILELEIGGLINHDLKRYKWISLSLYIRKRGKKRFFKNFVVLTLHRPEHHRALLLISPS